MGRYINYQSVLVRLAGKVKVTDDPENEPDRLPLLLLNRLINEAEAQVEYDLATRYAAPFQTIGGGEFSNLPDRPTKEILRTLCELLSVIRVLETDFGKGSGLDGNKYAESSQKRYDIILWGDDKKPGLISLRENSYNTYRVPPLPGLQANYHVAAVDTGFSGYVGRSDDHSHGGGSFIDQLNDPTSDFYNGQGLDTTDWY